MLDEIAMARRWVEKARNDLLDADNNLSSRNIPTDMVCFHCQQAVEKLLKAALIACGISPPRTHVLTMLADMLSVSVPSVRSLDDALAILTPYAVAVRYPIEENQTPSLEDAHEARRCAEEVLAWLRREFPGLIANDRSPL